MPQSALQGLAHRLQDRLRSLERFMPFQVQCGVRSNVLLVLIQHPPDPLANPQSILRALEQTVRDQPIVFGPTCPEGKLYLRILGQRQPYALHQFTAATAPPVASIDTAASTEPLGSEFFPMPAVDQPVTPIAPEASLENSLVVTAAKGDSQPGTPQEGLPRSQGWLWRGLAGCGVGITAFTAGLLTFSRPCMVGQCADLETAQALSQRSTQMVQTAKSRQELAQAHQQLTEANHLLSHVPLWSSRHQDAQTLLQASETQTATLDQILAAEKTADTALENSQTLPQSVADWQKNQSLWRSAIAQVSTVPKNSPLYPYAQQRLSSYQQNLAVTNQRLSQEQQAQKQVATAKTTASIAEARQGVAQSLESWQLARSTWQVAVNALKPVSPTTTHYTEAQQLLTQYVAKLATVRDRASQEEAANKAYSSAITLAEQAQTLEQQNQWSQAVTDWRNALTLAKQVPEGTFFRSQAQPLIASYSDALKLAEAKFQATSTLKTLEADLSRVCAGSPKICGYRVAPDVIRLNLMPAYEHAVKTAFVAGQAGDNSTLGGAVNHLESLQSALQMICNNAGIPLEVYGSDNQLVGSFNPDGQ